MAILYPSDDPYAPLVRETLDSADVPWHAALGRPALSGLAARSLLALLDLRERNFAREAVLDWIAARPTVQEAEEDPLPTVPVSAWDRLSRRAQVLQGADQWVSRFGRLIATLEIEEQARQDWHAAALVHESQEDVPHPTHDLEYARRIAASIQRLDRDTCPLQVSPPTGTRTWTGLRVYVGPLSPTIQTGLRAKSRLPRRWTLPWTACGRPVPSSPTRPSNHSVTRLPLPWMRAAPMRAARPSAFW